VVTPQELDLLADAIAERLSGRLSSQVDTDAMIDNHKVAELYRCSVPTVERTTKSGELPSYKIGRLRRYRKSEILDRRNEKGGAA